MSALRGPFGNADAAISQFNSKYRAKTSGGYTEIEITYDADEPAKEE
jgi:hypothetical protein